MFPHTTTVVIVCTMREDIDLKKAGNKGFFRKYVFRKKVVETMTLLKIVC